MLKLSLPRFFLIANCATMITAPLFSPSLSAVTNEEQTAIAALEQTSKAFSSVAKRAIPAVVFVKGESRAPGVEEPNGSFGYQNPFEQFGDDFLNRFFGMPFRSQPQRPAPQLSQGSGFFVSAEGYIMTNAHVIRGADKMTVILNDGRELEATLVGEDPHTDIAIIKVEGKDFPVAILGNSDEMDIGEWVIAIGSPFQLEASLTVGVVSAKGRQNLRITELEDFIQTDAAINPGNSGGPLLNLKSEVIGINTAIVSRSGGHMGIGFAIPSNMAKNVMDQLIDKGAVSRGFLGVSLQPINQGIAEALSLSKLEGALVSDVVKDSPAAKAGLEHGDVILEVNKTLVRSPQSFRNEISMMNPGSSVTLKIKRRGKLLTLPVTLGNASDPLASGSSVMQQFGMHVENLTAETCKELGYNKEEEGVVVTKIKPGSPVAMAGIRPGFLIQAIDDKKVSNLSDFKEALGNLEKKTHVMLLVRQRNMTRYYPIKLNNAPSGGGHSHSGG
jgi:serine protease Do